MSSRVLRGGQSVETQPLMWESLDQAGVPVATEIAACLAAPPPVDLEARWAERATSLMQEWQARLHAAETAAYEAGLEGARREAAAQQEGMAQRLARTLDEVLSQRARLRQEAEHDVVKLAVAIARRVLHRELTIDPEALCALVTSALDRLARQEVHTVRLHPAEVDMVRRGLDAIGPARRIEVVADAGLAPGTVLLEAALGTHDASPDSQLREIERGLTDLLPARTRG